MTPKAGDIVIIDFNPQAGREIKKRRPGLVLSPEAFNAVTGFALICPITSTPPQHGFQLLLPNGVENFFEGREGVSTVKIEQIRSLDYEARNALVVAQVPNFFLMRCRAIAQRILGM